MNTLGKRLLFGLAVILSLSGAVGAVIASVEYEPYGVPKPLRSQYKAKLDEIKRQNELASRADSIVRPKFVVENDHFDFGMLDPHSTNSHTFVVRNEGDAPLSLKVSSTSCKCTVGKLGSEIVAPGGQTGVTMTWNTGYQAEDYQQIATIATNDPLNKSVTLSIGGQVRAELIVPEEVSLGTINPGEVAEGSFVVYSQLWDDFFLESASSDLRGFQWYVDTISLDDPRLVDTECKWAWEVTLESGGARRGAFQGVVDLEFKSADSDETIQRSLIAKGRVRAPINFYGPEVHATAGIRFGTVNSGKRVDFPLVVRARGENAPEIEVLRVEPPELEAVMTPLRKEGEYRLVVSIPEDCPSIRFNRDKKHGYVEVGDPNDDGFRNWIPVYGAVAHIKK